MNPHQGDPSVPNDLTVNPPHQGDPSVPNDGSKACELMASVIKNNPGLTSMIVGDVSGEMAANLEERSGCMERYVQFGSWPSDSSTAAKLSRSLSGPALRGLLDGGIYGKVGESERCGMAPVMSQAREQNVFLNPDLKTIHICHSNIGRGEVDDLVRWMKHCTSLTNLSLRGCAITSEAAAPLRLIP